MDNFSTLTAPCDRLAEEQISIRTQDIESAVSILAEELGAEAVVELLETFLGDVPQRLEEMRLLAGGADQPTLRRSAHSLKGSSALFGAGELEAAAHHLEDLAAALQREGQVEQAELVTRIYESTRTVLVSVLQGLAGH